MAAVGNLVETVTHNLVAAQENKESFYQRGCWTNRMDKQDSKKLRGLIKKFLLETDEKARKIIKPFEQNVVGHDQVTAGVSLFYFEEASRV